MERIARLSPNVSVTSQIVEADLDEVKAQGFRAIINNRPDGEADDQPPGAALQAAAERRGLDYRHIPVVSGSVTDKDVSDFAGALADMPGPVLAFCRSGMRSATLWALAQAGHVDPASVLAATREAGYRLDDLRPRLEPQ
ncbi:MAG: TIGR01244 family sulfur transferase [Inquilinaceae bacterium]